ncbi:YceI family protein [Rheinheimera fenheensis]|uniref:YceI family protein n=1 Tax=Rheinheimera fenheensis TaxID=3152295 RepID=UPI00325DA6CF
MKVFAIALALASSSALATNWQLDNSQSALHFVSVKNDVVAETHRFKQLSGQWDGSKVEISIAVNSMDTQIPIRDERIWQYVLNTGQFAAINVTAPLASDKLDNLSVGQSSVHTVPLSVNIAGQTNELSAQVRITRLTDKSLQATTEAPVMLNTNSFNLTAGVAKLQELAGLKRIEPLVPVSFSVRFNQQ